MTRKDFNVFIGTTTGCLKGLVVGADPGGIKTSSINLTSNKSDISNKNEITCMEWATESCYKVVVGFKNKVRLYDTSLDGFTSETTLTDQSICGVSREDNNVIAGLTSGVVQSYDLSETKGTWKEYLTLNGGVIERMKRSSVKPRIIATGGRDNDLKLWDLNSKSIIFAAKNVKPDELQLQVPIWVSDIAFARRNTNVSICSRHGHVRVYDPLVPQRRPVFNCHQDEEDQVFTCISCTPNEHQLLVGSGTGDIFLVDTRGKTSFVGKYKGSCGAVKGISCPDSNNLVFSVSLDRHFRIHDFKTRKTLHKEYMVSRLTAVLPRTPFALEKFKVEPKNEEEEENTDIPARKKRREVAKALDRAFGCFETVE